MIVPLIAGALFCATPKLGNRTEVWTQDDQAALLAVQQDGCRQHNAEMPCLYAFIKKGEGDYTAVCGPEQRREDKK